MSYAHISSSSLELLPVLSSTPRAPAALRVEARARRSAAALRQVRYPIIAHAETALYLCLALGFAVAVCGFISLFHL